MSSNSSVEQFHGITSGASRNESLDYIGVSSRKRSVAAPCNKTLKNPFSLGESPKQQESNDSFKLPELSHKVIKQSDLKKRGENISLETLKMQREYIVRNQAKLNRKSIVTPRYTSRINGVSTLMNQERKKQFQLISELVTNAQQRIVNKSKTESIN